MPNQELPEGGVGASEPFSPGSPGAPRKDHELTEGVRAALLLDAELSAQQIEIDAREGVVELTGVVRSADERQRIEDLANTVEGVQRVENRLRITR